MSLFEELTERKIKCELCGSETMSLPGGGWDNDRICCTDTSNCGAEYMFATTTEVPTDEA